MKQLDIAGSFARGFSAPMQNALAQGGSNNWLSHGPRGAFGDVYNALLAGRGPTREAANMLSASQPPSMAERNAAMAESGGPTQAAADAMGDPSIAAGIVETANALGMEPEDLATIISYETAGTFDPTKRGPTTQWGQHRGLIQFGEPQAKEYGVDWSDPAGSQLGPDGAVADYFRDNGWKPGMGMLDAYSIVNAGAPGRYGASDANNGGAPGTVADKVNDQMAGHRAKARRLLASLGL